MQTQHCCGGLENNGLSQAIMQPQHGACAAKFFSIPWYSAYILGETASKAAIAPPQISAS